MEPHVEPTLGPVLTALARNAVATSFAARPPTTAALLADLSTMPALTKRAATFVTLERDGALRGCIGTLTALRPLAFDVVRNARLAARDPRLPPVLEAEVETLRCTVTILSPAEPIAVRGFGALFDVLRPGRDGLTLRDGGARRATFLPSVWANLPEPERFVAALLRKGRWPEPLWSGELRSAPWPHGLAAERYATRSFHG
ncbi:AmmeMemoRadiSam system protein A [Glycomyces sp. TRM65418]|uniref:AmmeMemoRadiSam system protein A n=1 Tax=Glycomyces sp. TRM65418 TaxID=2867006 RepID=UPI001CE584B5|nr:AmmeMemoRadiSam system protein A [Glycomyces sp. TRM65418]MCC3765473.1 AmmeMemoRadiSam system protein A [Glycomyces sp. TRM65418]QZD55082.1 AmmeMemoRadiSam system protein A [Glycomyces sp. TRM65418]